MKRFYITIVFIFVLFSAKAQYITQIIEYKPAPGQLINANLGLPENAESLIGGAAESGMLVSLGFWGGSITVGFENPIKNHKENPYGVDFTIFGNAYSGSSEPGIVQVMKDENQNGLADDTWYELRGSNHFFSSTKVNYEITYTNPNAAADVPWTDSEGNNGLIKYWNEFHAQEYYPSSENFPNINQENYTLHGTLLKDKTYNSETWVNYQFDYGYADNKPINRGVDLQTPDNPYTPETLEGCGGDAFDISWAVDAEGNSIDLDQIDFIRIYTGVAKNAGVIGEVSTEISGIAATKPNSELTGITDIIVSNHPENTAKIPVEKKFKWFINKTFTFEAYVISKGKKNENQNLIWSSDKPEVATITENGELTGVSIGETKIKCKPAENQDISRTFHIVIEETNSISGKQLEQIKIFPNPASNFISLAGIKNALIEIFSISGKKLAVIENYAENQKIDVQNFTSGVYFVKISTKVGNKTLKLLILNRY